MAKKKLKKKKLIYKIKGKEYLLVEQTFWSNIAILKVGSEYKKIGAILVGSKNVVQGMLGLWEGQATLEFLIPVNKFKEYMEIRC